MDDLNSFIYKLFHHIQRNLKVVILLGFLHNSDFLYVFLFQISYYKLLLKLSIIILYLQIYKVGVTHPANFLDYNNQNHLKHLLFFIILLSFREKLNFFLNCFNYFLFFIRTLLPIILFVMFICCYSYEEKNLTYFI